MKLQIEPNPFPYLFITIDSEHYGFIPWVHSAQKPICLVLTSQHQWRSQRGRTTRRWGNASMAFRRITLIYSTSVLIPSKPVVCLCSGLGRIFWLCYCVLSHHKSSYHSKFHLHWQVSLFSLSLSCHGVPLSVCGCLQPKTCSADSQ